MRGRMDQIIQTRKVSSKIHTVQNHHQNQNDNFASSSTFCLYLEPFLNTYYQTYQNIITLNAMPDGPLGQMVTLMNTPKLSPYQSNQNIGFYQHFGFNCKYVLLRYPAYGSGIQSGVSKNSDAFMGSDDIPSILGYLISCGYTIDTSLTKMLFQSRVVVGSENNGGGDRKLICMVTYNHNNK